MPAYVNSYSCRGQNACLCYWIKNKKEKNPSTSPMSPSIRPAEPIDESPAYRFRKRRPPQDLLTPWRRAAGAVPSRATVPLPLLEELPTARFAGTEKKSH
jgi:hypothetical protein